MNRIRAVVPSFTQAVRKPAAFGYILLTAHRAQIFLVAAILAGLFLVSPLLDSTFRSLYPDKTSKKLFGLVKKKSRNPDRKKAYDQAMFAFWLFTGGGTLFLLWLHIPKGMAGAMSRARDINKTRISSSNSGKTIIDGDLNAADNDSVNSDSIGPNGRYELRDELGRGGMGIVYKAWDNILDREVAMKKLPRTLIDDREYLVRFQREAKTLARLTHPAILQIFDMIDDRGEFWMALEYIDGGDLAAYLIENGKFPIADAAGMAQKIADGMAYAHRQEIIHRDLKPGNVLLTKSVNPKISDFGLARMPKSSELTQEGSILGSPRYMSPEQAAGESIDLRSDIYSLGIILYEMVTGQTPFDGDTTQILTKHITQTPPKPRKYTPDIPAKFEKLILKMLAKKPDDRIQEMAVVSDGLTAFAPMAEPRKKPSQA